MIRRCIFFAVFAVSLAAADQLLLSVNTLRPYHILNTHFVSFTIDPEDLLHGRPFGMGSNLTREMLMGLAPAYIRLGGTNTPNYVFRGPLSSDSSTQQITITEENWKKVNDFLASCGIDVIVCVGGGNEHQARDLAAYSDHHNYNLTWQLTFGDESKDVTGWEMGRDATLLRDTLNKFPRYKHATVLGPDVTLTHTRQHEQRVLDTLIEAGPAVDVVTWQPRWPHVTAVSKSDSSPDSYDFPPDYLEWDRTQLHTLLQRTLLNKPFWIGEPLIGNKGTFAEGIIYARRLAIAAKLGVEVVMKNPSLDDMAHPKPEYWVAVLHKQTLGQIVLDTRSVQNMSDVSVVVQCTPHMDGGVTIYTVNTNHHPHRVLVGGLPLSTTPSHVHHYVLTPPFRQPSNILSGYHSYYQQICL